MRASRGNSASITRKVLRVRLTSYRFLYLSPQDDDGGLRRLLPPHPRPLSPAFPRQDVALGLRQVPDVPEAARREVLLQGGQDLLQGGLLQVGWTRSSNGRTSGFEARACRSLFMQNRKSPPPSRSLVFRALLSFAPVIIPSVLARFEGSDATKPKRQIIGSYARQERDGRLCLRVKMCHRVPKPHTISNPPTSFLRLKIFLAGREREEGEKNLPGVLLLARPSCGNENVFRHRSCKY